MFFVIKLTQIDVCPNLIDKLKIGIKNLTPIFIISMQKFLV